MKKLIKKGAIGKKLLKMKLNPRGILGKKQKKLQINKKAAPVVSKEHKQQIQTQRDEISQFLENTKPAVKRKKLQGKFLVTGIPGLDELFYDGIPEKSSMLIAGGVGSGKTIMCLQILAYHASRGKKCIYMSFEESEERLTSHMEDFGWNPEKLKKSGKLVIKRFNPFEITRSVDALLMKSKGELLIDMEPVMFPENFKPDIIVVDSLTAIASTFIGKEDNYRLYAEQMIKFFEKIGATSFLITETKQIPTIFSTTGVEEFLADGVIVLYNIKRGNIRESAIEILKLRGGRHQKKIIALQITEAGIVVYPEQEIFGKIGDK